MTGIYKALQSFWGQFYDGSVSLPAHFSGYVPPETEFPYVTFDVAEGAALGVNVLTAHGWFLTVDGYNPRKHAAAFMDQVKTAIPPQGKKLLLPKGFAVLFPNDANFLSYVEDPSNHNIVGARVSYEIHFYE